MAKEKVVKIGETEYRFVTPTFYQSSAADMEYSKVYTKALTEGLLPRQSLERRLAALGAWTQADEDIVTELSVKSRTAMEDVILGKTKEEKDLALAQYYQIRAELLAKTSEKQSLFTNTAEAKGDEAKMGELVWQCIVKNEDGTRVWPSKDAFLSSSSVDVSELLSEFISFISGLDEKINSFEEVISSSYEDLEKVPEKVVKKKKEVPVVSTAEGDEKKEESAAEPVAQA